MLNIGGRVKVITYTYTHKQTNNTESHCEKCHNPDTGQKCIMKLFFTTPQRLQKFHDAT